jgi:hypothetical protein
LLPFSRDELKSFVNGALMEFEIIFRTFGRILSGPKGFSSFRFRSWSRTSCSDITRSAIEF